MPSLSHSRAHRAIRLLKRQTTVVIMVTMNSRETLNLPLTRPLKLKIWLNKWGPHWKGWTNLCLRLALNSRPRELKGSKLKWSVSKNLKSMLVKWIDLLHLFEKNTKEVSFWQWNTSQIARQKSVTILSLLLKNLNKAFSNLKKFRLSYKSRIMNAIKSMYRRS